METAHCVYNEGTGFTDLPNIIRVETAYCVYDEGTGFTVPPQWKQHTVCIMREQCSQTYKLPPEWKQHTVCMMREQALQYHHSGNNTVADLSITTRVETAHCVYNEGTGFTVPPQWKQNTVCIMWEQDSMIFHHFNLLTRYKRPREDHDNWQMHRRGRV